MENNMMISNLTVYELKEIQGGVPWSYYMDSSTIRFNMEIAATFCGIIVGIIESPGY